MKFLLNMSSTKKVLNEYKEDSNLLELKGNLRKELQQTLLDMLVEIFTVCKNNQIQAFLVGGSALGAVRHGGFIPWDDDVDIGMTREDYNKFVSIFENTLSEKYILNAPNYSENAISRFPKVLLKNSLLITTDTKIPELQKIYIDIFIMERIPENTMMRRLKGIWCNTLEFIAGQVWLVDNMDDNTVEALKKAGMFTYFIRIIIGRIFSFKNVYRWNDIVDKAVQYKGKSRLVGLPTGRKHYFGEILLENKLFPLQRVLFEEKELYIFNDVDYYLRNLYGDYMKIPSEEEREKHFIKDIRFGE